MGSAKTNSDKKQKKKRIFLNTRRRASVVRVILNWYQQHGRVLPWRNIGNAYRILVSEIMLQQTQVNRVLVKYPEFIRRFPSFKQLAAAQQRDVVLAWRGMGYNNRAVRLHRLAKIVVGRHSGSLPRTFEELLDLPGIGRYTANALLVSAFNQCVPIVDVNIQRVLSRLFWKMNGAENTRSKEVIWTLAEKLLPVRRAYEWNQALMDLGATVCIAHAPRCPVCPVASLCASSNTVPSSGRPLAKKESSKDSIPNRIYRGRIVEALRNQNGRSTFGLDALGRAIHPRYSSRHRRWLDTLVRGLEKDGLVKRWGIGTWARQRIALA